MDEMNVRCDRLWSMIVRTADVCARCGTDYGLQAAHIVPRRHTATRCDPSNGVCLCRACHSYFTVRPDEFDRWVEGMWPGRLARLRRDARTVNHPDWPIVYEGLLVEALLAGVSVEERVRW